MEKKTLENPAKSGHEADNELTPQQDRALSALLDSPSIVAAARKAGVGERSIRRWLKEDISFQDRLRDLRAEALSGASRQSKNSAGSGSVGHH